MNNLKAKLLIIGCIVLLGCSPRSEYGTSNSNAVDTVKHFSEVKLDPISQDFLEQLTSCAQYQITISQMALNKSNSLTVKDYAQETIDVKTSLNNELKKISIDQGLKINTVTKNEPPKEVTELENLSGRAFDLKYLEFMHKENEKIDAFISPHSNSPILYVKSLINKHLEHNKKSTLKSKYIFSRL